jgi:MFS family permease
MSTVGMAALVCAFAFVPFVTTVWQLAIMAGFFSIGMAFGNTGIIALISAAAEDNVQGTVLSVTSSLDSFSGICAPPLSTGLLGAFGSRYSAASSLLFALVAFVMGIRSQAVEKVGSPSMPQGDTAA